NDFRLRALAAGVVAGVCALVAGLTAPPGTEHFRRALFHSSWTWPHQLATGAIAVLALVALARGWTRVARLAAIAQVALILVGRGLAQRPYLVAPDLTIAGTAAPKATLELLLGALAVGSLVLFPSLWWLFRVFKRSGAE